jgi:hypothetical protein
MRRIVTLALISSMFLATPLFAARAPQVGQNASVAGVATADGKPAPNAKLQLRNVQSGQLVGTAQSTAAGTFTFTGLAAGTYAVEVLSAAGQIIGTSAAVSVAAGAAVTGVAVGASAAAFGAAAGGAAAAGAVAAGSGAAAAGISTAVVVTAVAAAAGVAGAVAIAKSNASPSR